MIVTPRLWGIYTVFKMHLNRAGLLVYAVYGMKLSVLVRRSTFECCVFSFLFSITGMNVCFRAFWTRRATAIFRTREIPPTVVSSCYKRIRVKITHNIQQSRSQKTHELSSLNVRLFVSPHTFWILFSRSKTVICRLCDYESALNHSHSFFQFRLSQPSSDSLCP